MPKEVWICCTNTSPCTLTPEQTLALMSYMLEHNRSHALELHDVAHALTAQGHSDAAEMVHSAVHQMEHGNEDLAAALKLIKEG